MLRKFKVLALLVLLAMTTSAWADTVWDVVIPTTGLTGCASSGSPDCAVRWDFGNGGVAANNTVSLTDFAGFVNNSNASLIDPDMLARGFLYTGSTLNFRVGLTSFVDSPKDTLSIFLTYNGFKFPTSSSTNELVIFEIGSETPMEFFHTTGAPPNGYGTTSVPEITPTVTEIATVPEPGFGVLIGLSLVVLVILARRRTRSV